MSDVVERVAQVLADAHLDGCEVTANWGPIAACVGPCLCRETARAVIKAMREPTEGMIECAGYVSDYSDLENIFAHSWRAMIDEALKDA